MDAIKREDADNRIEAVKQRVRDSKIGYDWQAQQAINWKYHADRLRGALILVLPMAKGYAHLNNLGNNRKFIQDAERVLKETPT